MKIVADTIVMIASSTANSLPTSVDLRSVRQRLEDEVRGRGPALAHRHLLALGPEPLVPGGDGVLAGRQPREAELPVVAGERVVRRGEHGEVSVHPGVYVAL